MTALEAEGLVQVHLLELLERWAWLNAWWNAAPIPDG